MNPQFKRTEILDDRREWIRAHLPSGADGFVMEDLDGIAVTFKNFKRGKMFFEFKWNVTELPHAQRITFQEIDQAMHRGDSTYRGFFVVTWAGVEISDDNDRYRLNPYIHPRVNGKSIPYAELVKFFLGEIKIACYFCGKVFP